MDYCINGLIITGKEEKLKEFDECFRGSPLESYSFEKLLTEQSLLKTKRDDLLKRHWEISSKVCFNTVVGGSLNNRRRVGIGEGRFSSLLFSCY